MKNLPLTGKACERRLRRNQRIRLGAAVKKREEKCGAPDAFFGHRKRAKVARRSRDGRREFQNQLSGRNTTPQSHSLTLIRQTTLAVPKIDGRGIRRCRF